LLKRGIEKNQIETPRAAGQLVGDRKCIAAQNADLFGLQLVFGGLQLEYSRRMFLHHQHAASTAAGARVRPRTDPQVGRRQQKLAKLEEQMESVAAELAMLEGQLAAPDLYAAQPGELARVTRRHATVREAHEALEAEWLALYGELQAG
jgi:hypothetical protein